jgi:hypothetical protein
MKGKFAAIINLLFFALGGVVFFLSFHYFIVVNGTASKYPRMSKLICRSFKDIEKDALKNLEKNTSYFEPCKRYPCVEPFFCTYLYIQLTAGSLAFIVGFVQSLTALCAIATKWASWVIWTMGHAASAFLSFVAIILVLATFIGFPLEWKEFCKFVSKMDQPLAPWRPTTFCKKAAPVHAVISGLNNESLKSTVLLFVIMLIFNLVACIVGISLMIWKRKGTSEGGLLEERAEQWIRNLKSICSLLKRPTFIRPTQPPAGSAPKKPTPRPPEPPAPPRSLGPPKKYTAMLYAD